MSIEPNIQPLFMSEEYRFYRNRVSIDLPRLDDELTEMPALAQTVGEIASYAIEVRDTAKEKLEFIYATIANKARQLIPDSGRPKSDARIAEEVPIQDEYQQVLNEYQQARLDARLWQNLFNSVEKKSYSLSTVGELVKSGFITPNTIQEKRNREIRNAASRT